MSIFKSLNFGGRQSIDFGVQITGEGVYDSPERDVELIEIPGRNGEYVIDNGRYRNITVTYPASLARPDQGGFSERMSDFRNWLSSRIGYQRLEDEYNLDEFRLGVYTGGLEVSPTAGGRAGGFNLSFNCKPQRFLKSGEVNQPIADGGTIFNPTEFDSQPLIEVEGTGDIGVGEYPISIVNEPIGYTELYPECTVIGTGTTKTATLPFNADARYRSGDTFHTGRFSATISILPGLGPIGSVSFSASSSSASQIDGVNSVVYISASGGYGYQVTVFFKDRTYTAGTGDVATLVFNGIIKTTGGTEYATAFDIRIEYDAEAGCLKFSAYNDANPDVYPDATSYKFEQGTINSTAPTVGDVVYIDCETGECYTEINGEIRSSNFGVTLGAELPVLKPGYNLIEYDNTVTSLKITPRWWRI